MPTIKRDLKTTRVLSLLDEFSKSRSRNDRPSDSFARAGETFVESPRDFQSYSAFWYAGIRAKAVMTGFLSALHARNTSYKYVVYALSDVSALWNSFLRTVSLESRAGSCLTGRAVDRLDERSFRARTSFVRYGSFIAFQTSSIRWKFGRTTFRSILREKRFEVGCARTRSCASASNVRRKNEEFQLRNLRQTRRRRMLRTNDATKNVARMRNKYFQIPTGDRINQRFRENLQSCFVRIYEPTCKVRDIVYAYVRRMYAVEISKVARTKIMYFDSDEKEGADS